MWNTLAAGLAVVSLVACNETSHLMVSEPVTGEVAAQNGPTCVNPTNHVLAIDGRGNYAPITFHEKRCAPIFRASELQQPRPSTLSFDNCAPIGRCEPVWRANTGSSQQLQSSNVSHSPHYRGVNKCSRRRAAKPSPDLHPWWS
jgi:hypothetical protein